MWHLNEVQLGQPQDHLTPYFALDVIRWKITLFHPFYTEMTRLKLYIYIV